jgi:hypothetical protein
MGDEEERLEESCCDDTSTIFSTGIVEGFTGGEVEITLVFFANTDEGFGIKYGVWE